MSVESRSGPGTRGMPREQREHQILDAAAVEFGRRGYARGSVRRVAAEVGVSRAMVHAYFATKDDLYAACVERAGRSLVAAVAAAQTADDPRDRARDTVHAFLTALDGRRDDWTLIYDRTLDPASRAAAIGRPYRRELAGLGLEGAAEVLGATGSLADADAELAGRLWLAMVDATVRWWIQRPDEAPEVAAARFARIATLLSNGPAV